MAPFQKRRRTDNDVDDDDHLNGRAGESSAETGPTYQPEELIATKVLDDLIGIEDIKEAIHRNIVVPFIAPAKAAILKIDAPCGVLLIGKPGTGKTSLVEAIANEIKEHQSNVKLYRETGTCMSRWLGESEGNLRALFTTAKETAPSIVFFDEVDGLGGTRTNAAESDSSHRMIVNTFMTQMNDLKKEYSGRVLVIAATNCFQTCDQALFRKGRFDVVVNMPLPNQVARKDILDFYFENCDITLDEEDMERLANETDGMVGSELEFISKTIYRNLVNDLFEDPKELLKLSMKQIKDRMKELSTEDLDYDEYVLPVLEMVIRDKRSASGEETDESMAVDEEEEE